MLALRNDFTQPHFRFHHVWDLLTFYYETNNVLIELFSVPLVHPQINRLPLGTSGYCIADSSLEMAADAFTYRVRPSCACTCAVQKIRAALPLEISQRPNTC